MLALAVIFCLIIGVLQAKIGQYPKTIKQILAEFKASGKVESQSWKTWINGAVILASGARSVHDRDHCPPVQLAGAEID